MSFAHVSCLMSHVKPRNGNAITPHEGKGDMRRETRDGRRETSGDGRQLDVGRVTLDDKTGRENLFRKTRKLIILVDVVILIRNET